jgi:choline dehydrogenase-like flavoprotein
MDHLKVVVGTLEIADPRRFRQHRLFPFVRGARFSTRFQAPPEFAEKRSLPFGLAAILLDRPNELVALRAALRARQRGAGWSQLAPLFPSLARGLLSVLATGVWPHLAGREFLARRTVLRLQVSVEQVPSGDNYLAARDGQVDMHWQPTPGDIDALQQYTKYFVEDVDWSALGLRLTEVRTLPTDGFHMMGGTRMAVRPEDGVVDARGRVFGCRNLRVIGPSVFPTGAVANPTFTACALAWLAAEDMSLPEQGPARDGEFKIPVRTQRSTRTGGPS